MKNHINPYKLSKDYNHLKQLLDNGMQIVCFVDYSQFRDVCRARLMHSTLYSFSVRGFLYDEWFRRNAPDFKERCERLNLEFIDPETDLTL